MSKGNFLEEMDEFELQDLLDLLADGHELGDVLDEIESAQMVGDNLISIKLENGKEYLIEIVDEKK